MVFIFSVKYEARFLSESNMGTANKERGNRCEPI